MALIWHGIDWCMCMLIHIQVNCRFSHGGGREVVGRVEGVCLHLSYSLHFEIRELCFVINCLNLPDVAETNVVTKMHNFSCTANYLLEYENGYCPTLMKIQII